MTRLDMELDHESMRHEDALGQITQHLDEVKMLKNLLSMIK